MSNQDWANVIRSGARSDGTERVIEAINLETRKRHAKQADVVVACAQILGQVIARAGADDIAREMRAGIHEMIDGYAMQVATTED